MASSRGMLVRIRKIEQRRKNPILKRLGSFEKFSEKIRTGIETGIYDPRDMPVLEQCITKWIKDFN